MRNTDTTMRYCSTSELPFLKNKDVLAGLGFLTFMFAFGAFIRLRVSENQGSMYEFCFAVRNFHAKAQLFQAKVFLAEVKMDTL